MRMEKIRTQEQPFVSFFLTPTIQWNLTPWFLGGLGVLECSRQASLILFALTAMRIMG